MRSSLIIIGDQNPAPVYGLDQIFRIQHGQGLSGVKDVVDPPGLAGARVIHHVIKIAGRDNNNGLRGIKCVEIQTGRVFHGARVEAGDLVVREVGSDVGAGREFIFDDFDVFRRNPVLCQPIEVPVIIMADA